MKIWLKRFEKFSQLHWLQKIIYLKVFLVILIIKISLGILSFPNFKKLYSLLSKTYKQKTYHPEYIQTLVLAIKACSPSLTATCLPQALALKFFLRKSPLYILKIGVQKDVNNKFEAHAWIETNGEIILGNLPDFGFMPLWDWQ